MPVSYNSNYIIPAPFLNLQKSYTRHESLGMLNPLYKLTLTGKLLPCKGSPTGSGGWWSSAGYPPDEANSDAFNALLNKQEAMRHLFATDGKILEVSAAGGTTISCRPTVDSIQFTEGQWFSYIDYTIELTATRVSGALANEDDLLGNDYPQYLSSASENWSLEMTDEHEGIEKGSVCNLTHNVNAVGLNAYDNNGVAVEGWEQARSWVYPRLGLDSTKLTGTSGLGLPSYYTGYNYRKTEETDETAGRYNVVENWTITSGNVIEEFNVDVRLSSDSSIAAVTAQGSIRGLESSSTFSPANNTKWNNALSKFQELNTGGDYNTIYNRALTYSTYTNLNPQTISKVIGRNPVAGNINYTYEYDTRPTNYVSGAIYENINIQSVYSSDVYASIPIPGRATGPILQDMGTITSPKTSINIDVIMPYYSGSPLINGPAFAELAAASPLSQTEVVVDAYYVYLTGIYSQVFVDSSSDNWDIKTGKFSRSVTWTVGDCS